MMPSNRTTVELISSHAVLGRSITLDEATEVRNMARRLAAIRLLEPQLDENYQKLKEETYTWSGLK